MQRPIQSYLSSYIDAVSDEHDRQQYIVWVKIIYFSFMPKIIKIMFHEDI